MDYDMLTEGIVNSINQYAEAQASMMSMKNQFMMDEVQNQIKTKRIMELEKQKNEIISPMQRIMMKRYMSENPSQIQDFLESGSPAMAGLAGKQKEKMQQAGTGGANKTSQGINVPSTYTPPEEPAYKTVKMGANSFERMGPTEIAGMNIIEKAKRGETLSQGEKKLIGITDKKALNITDVKKVEEFAKASVIRDKIASGQLQQEEAKYYTPTNEELIPAMEKFFKYFYPEADTSEIFDTTKKGSAADAIKGILARGVSAGIQAGTQRVQTDKGMVQGGPRSVGKATTEYKVGEKREVKGKGTFEYIGNDQWKKIK